MSQHDHDVWDLLDKIQMDHRVMGARIVQLRAQVAALDLPGKTVLECGHCRMRLPSQRRLDEHVYISHDGPHPPHWLGAEQLAAPDEAAA